MTFSCDIDFGNLLGCQGNGGTDLIYLFTWNKNTIWVTDANNKVIGVTGSIPTLYQFEQMPNTAGYTFNGSYGDNRTLGRVDTLNLKLDHYDEDLIERGRALTRAYLGAIIVSNEGSCVLLGKERRGKATADTGGFGVADTDMNGMDLTITWSSPNGAFAFDETLIGTTLTVGN